MNDELAVSLSGDEDLLLALDTLREVARDAAAPAAARAQAARTIFELKGKLGRHAPPPVDDSKALAGMSRAELEAELRRSGL